MSSSFSPDFAAFRISSQSSTPLRGDVGPWLRDQVLARFKDRAVREWSPRTASECLENVFIGFLFVLMRVYIYIYLCVCMIINHHRRVYLFHWHWKHREKNWRRWGTLSWTNRGAEVKYVQKRNHVAGKQQPAKISRTEICQRWGNAASCKREWTQRLRKMRTS